jgi:hypothetical protein
MKIPFEEILPSDDRLYAGTRNNPNLSIWGAFSLKMYHFPLLTLKKTVKVIHFQGQNIKSE